MSRCARAVGYLDGADEAGVGLNAVLWIIQALSSAIKRNDPPLPPHTGVSHFFIVLRYARCRMRKNRVTVWRHVVWQSNVTSFDGLTSRRVTVWRHVVWRSDVTFHQANHSHKTYTCQKKLGNYWNDARIMQCDLCSRPNHIRDVIDNEFAMK